MKSTPSMLIPFKNKVVTECMKSVCQGCRKELPEENGFHYENCSNWVVKTFCLATSLKSLIEEEIHD